LGIAIINQKSKHTILAMLIYSIPTSIDRQIEYLLIEQIKAEQYKRSQYLELLQQSELKIERLQAALNSLTKY
jgi:hypothetical protein